jgi:hypothetical protein
MDWNRAIERNSEALRKIVAALFALAAAALTAPGQSRRSLGEGARAAVMLPRHLYAAILLILRPAESALRRLIVIAARGLSLKPRASRPLPADLPVFPKIGVLGTPAFTLIDPLKRFSLDDFDNNALPHFNFQNADDAAFHAPHLLPLDEPVDASQLLGRLRALRHALTDLPRQARRLARWQARRDLLLKAMRPTRITPFRPGLPPGWRQRSIHEVDDVLRECHGLALDLMNEPDSS